MNHQKILSVSNYLAPLMTQVKMETHKNNITIHTSTFSLNACMKNIDKMPFFLQKKVFQNWLFCHCLPSCPSVKFYAPRKEIFCKYLSFNDLQKAEKRWVLSRNAKGALSHCHM